MDDTGTIFSHLLFLLVGAGIAGYCSYLFRSESSASGVAKEHAARRLGLIEEVALQAGAAHHLFQKYFALVAEAVRLKDDWPRQRREELEALSLQLVETINDLSQAESKLLLLDEKNLHKILRTFTVRIAAFRKAQYVRANASEEELNEARKQIVNLHDKFFELLSSRYDHR